LKRLGLTGRQIFVKRLFDITFSIVGLLLTSWLILIAFILASIETKSNGFFIQTRVGRAGQQFKIFKIKTMRTIKNYNTVVTTSKDPRITRTGKIFRKAKIDELPQLLNILLGHMSFVGPRPDVPGFADQLTNQDDKVILQVRPGITGLATLYYRDEEDILSKVDNPELYNKTVIFPNKIKINRYYIENYSIYLDVKCIFFTIFGGGKSLIPKDLNLLE
jgi:lipopolysaccharide/colanic/teichoic acid biosynthesis glycosyltransferase